jgi:hypothetical protein
MGLGDDDFPAFQGKGATKAPGLPCLDFQIGFGFSEDIRPGISRVAKQVPHRWVRGILPAHLAEKARAQPARHLHAAVDHPAEHFARAAELQELPEHASDYLLNIFVGIEEHSSIGSVHEANGKLQLELPSLSFFSCSFQEARSYSVELRLIEEPFEPELQTIVLITGVVHSAWLSNHRLTSRAEVEQSVPLSVGACQSAGLNAHDETDTALADLTAESREALALLRTAGGNPQVFVYHHDALREPTERFYKGLELILPPLALEVAANLRWRGLAYVDIRHAIQMLSVYLFFS